MESGGLSCSKLAENDITRYQSLSDDELFFPREASRSESDDGLSFVSGRRTRSLCAFQLNEYSLGEIRRLHERLAARKPGVFSAGRPSFRDFTRKQILTLTCLGLVEFSSFCSMSILAPFFPKEAAEKGMSETTAGLVFSFYALIIFILSPAVGKIIPHVGAKFVFISGLFLASGCHFLFGLLDFISDSSTFTTFCFLIRGLEATGAAAYSTALYVFIVEVFPDNIGAILGLMETFVGLGMSLGPALGGWLYSLAGFQLPFYTLGVVLMSMVPLSGILIPATSGEYNRRTDSSMLALLKIPSIILLGGVIVTISIIWSFLDPTLEPYLRKFSMTPEKIGLVFLLFSGIYGVTSPLWGWLSDRWQLPWLYMVIGLFGCSASLFLLGPASLLISLPSSPWVAIVSLSFLGAFVSLGLLPTFQAILDQAEKAGFREDTALYSLVAGLWSSLYALGEVIGPSVGGLLTEYYEFPLCAGVVAVLSAVLGVVVVIGYFFLPRTVKVGSNSDSGITSRSSREGLDEERPLITREKRLRRHWVSEGDC